MMDIDHHARRITELVEGFERGGDDRDRQPVFELIEHIDHVHRSCVWRLFELMTELGGKGFVERIAADPLVKTLFVLYDLIPVDPLRPIQSDVDVSAPTLGGFVPLRSLRGSSPSWRVAFAKADLPAGVLRAVEIDGIPVLLCAVDAGDNVFAYRNACPGTMLPLHLGSLAQGELHCPWHGCRYDPRTGRQIGGSGLDLEPFRVDVRDGTVYVATNHNAV